MEYTVQKLARLAGVSARTLRFYDEIGLLKPSRVSSAGYRIYGPAEVDALQQILFLRALGLDLQTITSLLQDPAYDRLQTLRSHLGALKAKKAQLDLLIDNVHKTIEKEEGIRTMTDKEKFEGLKAKLIDENEAKYGKEIQDSYGEETVRKSNEMFRNMKKEDYDAMQALSAEILAALSAAVKDGASPEGETGREIAAMHKRWLCYTWPQYSSEAHIGLGQMYVDDSRFAAYYDGETPGCAQFLRDAIAAWAAKL